MANKFKENKQAELFDQAETEESSKTPKGSNKIVKGLGSIISGNFLSKEDTLKHLPFIIFLSVLALIYISNNYYAMNKIRQLNKVSNELKELRSEYITSTSELMFISKQSEVAKAADSLGLKESIEPPKKITVSDTSALMN